MHACARGSSAHAELQRFPHQHTADTLGRYSRKFRCVSTHRGGTENHHMKITDHIFSNQKMKNSRVSEDISSKIPICQMQSHKVDEISIKNKVTFTVK